MLAPIMPTEEVEEEREEVGAGRNMKGVEEEEREEEEREEEASRGGAGTVLEEGGTEGAAGPANIRLPLLPVVLVVLVGRWVLLPPV